VDCVVQFIIAGAFGIAAARKSRCLVCQLPKYGFFLFMYD